jgi:hypothetical protein
MFAHVRVRLELIALVFLQHSSTDSYSIFAGLTLAPNSLKHSLLAFAVFQDPITRAETFLFEVASFAVIALRATVERDVVRRLVIVGA